MSTAAAAAAAWGLVLVVDPCVVGDGRVVEVSAWVKEGGVDAPGPVCLSAQEVVDRGGSCDLGTAVGRSVGWEGGIDPVGPIGGLVPSAIRCIGDGYLQVGVLVCITDRSGDRDGSPGGRLSTAAAAAAAAWGLVLVVDPCVVSDGRVVEVAAWVKEGGVSVPGPVCLSVQEVVDRGGSGDLGSSVGRSVGREGGIDPVGPIGRLVPSAIRCVGDGHLQVLCVSNRSGDRDGSPGGRLRPPRPPPPPPPGDWYW